MTDDHGTDGGVAGTSGASGASASGRRQGEAPPGADGTTHVPAEESEADGTGPDHPLAVAVSAHTGDLPTAAVVCLVTATVGGTTIVAAGSGMFLAGAFVVVAGLAAGGGARLAWSARQRAGSRRSPEPSDARAAERASGDGGESDGDVRATGSTGQHGLATSNGDRAWLRLAGGGAAFVIAGVLWATGVGAGVGASSGVVAAVLHVVILSACGLALVGASAPEDLDWRGIKTATIASIFAAVVPYLGAEVLGGGIGGVLGAVTRWLGDMAWALLLVLAWWDSPVGGTSTPRFAAALATGLLLVGGVALGVSVALSRLDLARLAPRAGREAVRDRLEEIAATSRRTVLGVGIGLCVTLVLFVLQLPSRLSPAAVEALLAVLGASVLRVPLVVALLGVWGGLLAIKLVVVLANVRNADLVGWLPAGLGGGAVWLGVSALLVGLGPSLAGGADDSAEIPLAGLTLAELLGEAGPAQQAAAVGLLSATGGVLTIAAFVGVAILHKIGAFEGPSGVGAMAAGGLATAAIAAGVGGTLPLAVVGTMGAGLVAWDAGAVGATLVAETGDGSVAANSIVARVAATAGMVLLGGVVALGIVAAVAGNLRPALQVPVLLGLVAALALGLWRLWALSSHAGDDAATIGPDAIRRAPIDHPSATSIVVGLLVWIAASSVSGFDSLMAFRAGGVTFLVVRVLLGIWITRVRDEPAGEGSRAVG